MKLTTSADLILKIEAKREVKRLANRSAKKKSTQAEAGIYTPRTAKQLHMSTNTAANRAAIADERKTQDVVSRKRALEASPDLSKMVEVRIDNRTSIFINPKQSAEEARERFLNRINNRSDV